MTKQTNKTNPRQYVLTGGPSSGKTTLINELAKSYYTINESPEEIIKELLEKGVKEPWTLPNFDSLVTDRRIQKQNAIPENVDIAFIDRGVPDSLAYCNLHGYNIPEGLEEASRNQNYETVFLIENLGQCLKTDVRHEDLGEALKIEKAVEETYQQLGYNVIRVPPTSVKSRLEFILNNVEKEGI